VSSIRYEDFVPPPELFAGRMDYADVARMLFDALVETSGLQPGERVLDVGCGTGRVAAPLVEYLGPEGSYEGFDRNAARIEFCNERIAPLHPRFRFQAVDVFNSERQGGTERAGDFRFPYPDDDFDLVFLLSVFTHMLPDGVERYLSEIARVLKPGGRSVITWFLLNDESLRLLEEQREQRRLSRASNAHVSALVHDMGVYRVSDRARPEAVVAYQEEFALENYARNGLEVEQPIYYGSWIGRENTLINQDVVVARLTA
jgi:ubiquinone/menaquinone biosynthesis C-methylase UbiE